MTTSEKVRELAKKTAVELRMVGYAQDDAMAAMAEADQTENWPAYEKAENEYHRRKWNVADLEKLSKALEAVASALEGLEDCGEDVLKNLGLD